MKNALDEYFVFNISSYHTYFDGRLLEHVSMSEAFT